MKLTGRTFSTILLVLALGSGARAGFGTPAQGPGVDPPGTVTIYPGLGVLAGGDDFGDIESFYIAPRIRVTLVDSLQIDGRLGGFIGDLNAFNIGGGLRYQFLDQAAKAPVELAGFVNLDLAVGEIDVWRTDLDVLYFTMLMGVLVGHTFETKTIGLTPYFGLGLGFTVVHVDLPEPADDTDTEIAFDIVFGFDVGITETLSVFTEFNIGPTDGMPILFWHLGLAFRF